VRPKPPPSRVPICQLTYRQVAVDRGLSTKRHDSRNDGAIGQLLIFCHLLISGQMTVVVCTFPQLWMPASRIFCHLLSSLKYDVPCSHLLRWKTSPSYSNGPSSIILILLTSNLNDTYKPYFLTESPRWLNWRWVSLSRLYCVLVVLMMKEVLSALIWCTIFTSLLMVNWLSIFRWSKFNNCLSLDINWLQLLCLSCFNNYSNSLSCFNNYSNSCSSISIHTLMIVVLVMVMKQECLCLLKYYGLYSNLMGNKRTYIIQTVSVQ
jgi:hypothetical protein